MWSDVIIVRKIFNRIDGGDCRSKSILWDLFNWDLDEMLEIVFELSWDLWRISKNVFNWWKMLSMNKSVDCHVGKERRIDSSRFQWNWDLYWWLTRINNLIIMNSIGEYCRDALIVLWIIIDWFLLRHWKNYILVWTKSRIEERKTLLKSFERTQ